MNDYEREYRKTAAGQIAELRRALRELGTAVLKAMPAWVQRLLR